MPFLGMRNEGTCVMAIVLECIAHWGALLSCIQKLENTLYELSLTEAGVSKKPEDVQVGNCGVLMCTDRKSLDAAA